MSVAGYAMNLGKHILFLVVEGNKGNRGDIQNKYGREEVSLPYEDEALKCVEAWKKHGLDIPVKIVCVNSNPPRPQTVKKLVDLGCEYLHWPNKEADCYKCGYWNVPLAGRLLEERVTEDTRIIHIDLDMTLFRPFQPSLLADTGETVRIAINEFRPTEQKNVKINGPRYEFEINTGFIYSRAGQGFYKTWHEKLAAKTATLSWDDPAYSIWEERICDEMHFEQGYPFSFFKPFQINGSLERYADEELQTICFNHCHIHHKKRSVSQLEDYIKRTAKKCV